MNQPTLGNGRMRPFQGSSGHGLPLTCVLCLHVPLSLKQPQPFEINFTSL